MAKPPALREPPFSPLELAVLDALAWELKPDFPDLAAQLHAAEPGRRTNTGAGFYNAITLPRLRTGASSRKATGLFGTVHAVVAGLPDAVGFQLQLRDGRVMALMADAYDQDTREIDFLRARFDQIFYLDTQGRSRAYVPELSTTQTRADARHRTRPNERVVLPGPMRAAIPATAFGTDVPTASDAARVVDPARWTGPAEPMTDLVEPDRAGAAAVRGGVWATILILGALLAAIGVPVIALGVGGFIIGRWLTNPSMTRFIQDQVDAFRTQQQA